MNENVSSAWCYNDLMAPLVPAGLQVTSSTETLARQEPCQGWLEAPILPWEWKGPLSTRDWESPILQP